MSTAVSTLDLSTLLGELSEIARDAEKTFGSLSTRQLNWKPGANQWSVGECFDHLITTNRHYYPAINNAIRGDTKTTFFERLPLLPGLFGNLLLRSLQPDSARKLKAPSIFQPASSQISGDVIRDFVAHQHELSALMQQTSGLPLERIIITSPVAAFITYSLMDAYRILVTHEKRHFLQAKRVLEMSNFPNSL